MMKKRTYALLPAVALTLGLSVPVFGDKGDDTPSTIQALTVPIPQ